MQNKAVGDTYRAQSHNNVTWVDVESPSAEVLLDLEKTYGLHPAYTRECVQKVQHVQIEREENYLFLVLHVPIFTSHQDNIKINQVGVFLGRDFLITIRSGNSPFINDLFEVCSLSDDKANEYFEYSGFLLQHLIGRLLHDISTTVDDINNELDEIEDIVFDNRNSDGERIGKLRQKIVRLARVIGPKRMLLQDLAKQVDAFTGKSVSKYYANNTKLVGRLWEEIGEAKETIEVYKDADFTMNTEQTNRILAILTLVFTFTIPTTVIGTLYGMNVFLPGGLATSPWLFMGKYTTFIILMLSSAGFAIGMFWYFKRKKWF